MGVSSTTWVSQLGMLAATLVYVNAGTQLAQIESLSGILSPALIGSFVLLAIFPLLARKILTLVKARQVYAPWRAAKPRQFDTNPVVIGAGSAGLVSAYIAAAVKAKVTLIEAHRMGGDCLNTGCVPSKALLRSAKFLAQAKRGPSLGLKSVAVDFAFKDLMLADQDGSEVRIALDAVLVAVGRVANTTGYGLEELGIPVTAQRTVEVNEFLQTRYPNIYACGDVAGPFQFTHTAAPPGVGRALSCLDAGLTPPLGNR